MILQQHYEVSYCLVPTAGYLFTYYNSKLSKEREAQIDRVNAQVGTQFGMRPFRNLPPQHASAHA